MTASTQDSPGTDFIVERDNLRHCRFVPANEPRLAAGEALLRVAMHRERKKGLNGAHS